MTMLENLEIIVKSKGTLTVTHTPGGSGMGLYWCADIDHKWPHCHGHTLEEALKVLVNESLRLEKEELQKRINEIDSSSQL